ncbi:uncharacterized protein K02A2.6-like [Uranotaenia lowii]|uniref:uncharacterized protein K02A2.6-like n=1 Tax=Uranotaenia lowii TaxID=190385 RepID=UPI0024790B3E|nr:uncharacterized protein K02A2.6-like [Uranotaenia lowii]
MQGDRLVIPSKLQQQILACAHDGHPGICLMKRRLRKKVWWPKMDDQIESFVKKCHPCTLVSSSGPPEPMKRAVDFSGPLPCGHNLLVMIDYYSRFAEVVVMKQITADLTIKALFETFSRFGIPETLRTDQGPQFVSEALATFCKEYCISHQKTAPYWPQANGEVERFNRSILKRLKICQEIVKADWKRELRNFLLMYNSTPHSITGTAPSALMFGRVLRDKLPTIYTDPKITDESIRDRDWERKLQVAETVDIRRGAKPSALKEGHVVVAKRMQKDHKLSSNFHPEKLKILSRTNTDVELQSEKTGKVYHRNVAHLKPMSQDSGQTDQTINKETSSFEPQPTREQRPTRALQKPGYLQDYVAEVSDF